MGATWDLISIVLPLFELHGRHVTQMNQFDFVEDFEFQVTHRLLAEPGTFFQSTTLSSGLHVDTAERGLYLHRCLCVWCRTC